MKRIHFFASKEDLLPLIELVERKGPLRYVRSGHYPLGTSMEVFNSACNIPNLGQATNYNAIGSETFVVCEPETVLTPRPIGADRFAVDQLCNPDTITFTPAGIWNEEIMLYGRVATVYDSKPAQKLMRRFHSVMKKSFCKMDAYFVGPGALELLKSGKRLTIGAYSPHDYDLRVSV